MSKIFFKYLFVTICGSTITFSISRNIIVDCPPGTPGAPATNNYIARETKLNNCTKQPCVLEKGSWFNCSAILTIHASTKYVMCNTRAMTPIGPLLVYTGDLCQSVVGGCHNLVGGKTYSVALKTRIADWIPPYEGTLRLIMTDDENVAQWCGEVDIILKEKPLNLDIGGSLFEGLG